VAAAMRPFAVGTAASQQLVRLTTTHTTPLIAGTVRCHLIYHFLFSRAFSLLSSTLPGPIASEVTTIWRYTNTFIIIIIIIMHAAVVCCSGS